MTQIDKIQPDKMQPDNIQMEELLQNRLEALENGIPLEEVLAGLPTEAASLAPMIRLAAQTRQLPSPTFSAATYHRQHGMIKAVASAKAPAGSTA